MLVRIIVGVLLLPLLFIVLFFAPGWVLAAAISLISALSVWELLGGVGLAQKRLIAYAAVFAAAVPVYVYIESASLLYQALPLAGIALFLMLLFAEAVINYGKISFAQIGMVFSSAFCIPFFLSSLIRIMAHDAGEYLIMIPFIAAFLGDTCAMFSGLLWGKKKLTPVSPNKTVAGAAGGLAGVVLGMAAYYGIIVAFFDRPYSMGSMVFICLVCGLPGAIAAQLGDLSMSLIKREFEIKDFGKIFPGHGGVLDRFDSLLFAAPVIEVLLVLLPAIEVLI